MSGSALGPSAIARDADTYARHLAKAINCPNFVRNDSKKTFAFNLQLMPYICGNPSSQDNVVMVDCLRQKSVDDILRVDLMTPQYLTAFGPIVDGIVVPSEPRQLMQSKTGEGSQAYPINSMANLNNVDLMFGVTRVESPFIFSPTEERHGIDLTRRERILRTLVRNLFDYHQQV
jgi:neuroligin